MKKQPTSKESEMATKKTTKKQPAGVEIVFEINSLGQHVARMNRKFEDMIFRNADTEEEWLATLISLSFEAARVAQAMGFGKQEFLNSLTTTAEDVYGKAEQAKKATTKKAAAKKPAAKKPAPKKPVAKKGAKK